MRFWGLWHLGEWRLGWGGNGGGRRWKFFLRQETGFFSAKKQLFLFLGKWDHRRWRYHRRLMGPNGDKNIAVDFRCTGHSIEYNESWVTTKIIVKGDMRSCRFSKWSPASSSQGLKEMWNPFKDLEAMIWNATQQLSVPHRGNHHGAPPRVLSPDPGGEQRSFR